MKILPILIIAFSAMFILTTCCDDCPTCPESEQDEHLFYIAPYVGNIVKIFSVERERIVDSIIVDSVAEDDNIRLHVIGDDSLLAVSTYSKTFVIDLESKKCVESFEANTPVFSRDSRFYYSRGSVKTYPEHDEIFNQPDASTWGKFDNQSEILTFIHYTENDHAEILLYKILGGLLGPVLQRINGNEIPENPMMFCYPYPIKDQDKMFLNYALDYHASDFGADAMRNFNLPLGLSGLGFSHVVSPDDKYTFATDVGQMVFGFTPTGYIYVHDVASEDSIGAIGFDGMDMVRWLTISYDSKYMAACPYNEPMHTTHTTFCLIDAKNFEVIGSYDCGYQPGHIASKYCSEHGQYFQYGL